MNLQGCNVVLASGSPRRRELLTKLFDDFEILVPGVDESRLAGETPIQMAKRLAWDKASKASELRPGCLIVAADTVVFLDDLPEGEVFEKPSNASDAERILGRLSGRAHYVATGVAVFTPQRQMGFADQTRVTFRDLEEIEIRTYVSTGESLDKAGAYAIQGGAEGFVASIEGSLSNVVGLPMELLAETLKSFEDGD